jgi:hypothetical protein
MIRKPYEMTDKKIEKAIAHHTKAGGGDACYSGNIYPMRTVAKSAQKEILEWLNKPCNKHKIKRVTWLKQDPPFLGKKDTYFDHRYECSLCIESLLKDFGIKP